MRISGFSFARNAVKLHYPLREALLSILPVVDELVVVVAAGDPDDDTRGVIESIADPRVRIIEAEWDDGKGNAVYADLTNVALDACSGDWCFYIQADEVVHEDGHQRIRDRCEELLDDHRVEGLLFDFLHFFGDYDHIQAGHGWYHREIRIIRNGIGVRSVRDAQSFRYADQKRIDVARVAARVFHYGWVRHPRFMQSKATASTLREHGQEVVEARFAGREEFDYGPLGGLGRFEGSHPAVMDELIAAMDWSELLRLTDPPGMHRSELHKHERRWYRFLSAVTRATGVDLNHTNHRRVLQV